MTASMRELLERGAADSPETVIVSGAGQHLTWRDLRAEARRVAAALARDGVKPQDRVVFVGKNDPAYFGYLFGCALAGAVPVPLNRRLSAAELIAMIENSGAEVAFTDEAGAPAVELAEAELPALRTIVARASTTAGRPWPPGRTQQATTLVPPPPESFADLAETPRTSGDVVLMSLVPTGTRWLQRPGAGRPI